MIGGGGGDRLDLAPSRRALLAEVDALAAAWGAGDPDDPALRGECGRRLQRLRARWREAPLLFGSELVGRLRGLADALARPPGAGARSRACCARCSAIAAFRPGQEPIIDAVLRGRDCIGVMPTGAGQVAHLPDPGPACSAAPRWSCRRSSR